MADRYVHDRELARHGIYQREKFIKADFPTHCSYGPVSLEDPCKWQGVIMGPPGSPYEDGIFFLSIDLPDDYPTRPPIIKFLTKVYHPNIDENGNIYIDILEEDQWNPIQTIESLLLSICSLLDDPNPVDPLNPSSNLFKTNKQEFNKMARKWTKNYASDLYI
uniref:ubiquitin-conjugating enzyme E2 11-like n=1 Tax=Fragaria vesca subsp. vesca TaxID=101020 RepID=UPI0005C9B23A|nr:PREDICTED: ubiquitin-conjugating enzyme E2 11-like [Fragaria vesca subsp. vesca]